MGSDTVLPPAADGVIALKIVLEEELPPEDRLRASEDYSLLLANDYSHIRLIEILQMVCTELSKHHRFPKGRPLNNPKIQRYQLEMFKLERC